MISRWWCPLVSFKLLRIQLLLSVPAARVYSPSYSYGILPKWLDLAHNFISICEISLNWIGTSDSVKSVQIRSFTWPKYGKIKTRKNLLEQFLHSARLPSVQFWWTQFLLTCSWRFLSESHKRQMMASSILFTLVWLQSVFFTYYDFQIWLL